MVKITSEKEETLYKAPILDCLKQAEMIKVEGNLRTGSGKNRKKITSLKWIKAKFVYEAIFDKGILSPAFNQAYIIVMPKAGNDHIQCAHYRTISLTDVDTKIFNSSASKHIISDVVSY